ncbi:MAG: hypothetical protein QXV35_00730 [Archaeoglobaceae archaeon]
MSEITKKFNLKKDDPGSGFTTLHKSRSCDEDHCTMRGNDFVVHIYGLDLPWPIGKTADKWFSKKDNIL